MGLENCIIDLSIKKYYTKKIVPQKNCRADDIMYFVISLRCNLQFHNLLAGDHQEPKIYIYIGI
jgi:hypothetical protein